MMLNPVLGYGRDTQEHFFLEHIFLWHKWVETIKNIECNFHLDSCSTVPFSYCCMQ